MLKGDPKKKERRIDPSKMKILPPEEIPAGYRARYLSLSRSNKAKMGLLLSWYDANLLASAAPKNEAFLLKLAKETLKIATPIAKEIIREELLNIDSSLGKRVFIRLLENTQTEERKASYE